MNTEAGRRQAENLDLLRKTVLRSDARGRTHHSEIRGWVFDNVITSCGATDRIPFVTKWTFSQLSANNLGQDSGLVADVTQAWTIAYPGDEAAVLDALFTISLGYIRDGKMAEGVLIGLLEMANAHSNTTFEANLFERMHHGTLFDGFCGTNSTLGGPGRLSKALTIFLKGIWDLRHEPASTRLPQVVLLLRRFRLTLVTFDGQNGTILECLTNELISRLLMNAPVDLKLDLLCGHVENKGSSDLEKWRRCYPRLSAARHLIER